MELRRFTIDKFGDEYLSDTGEMVPFSDIEKLLRYIQGMCGNPNASDGCRNVIKVIDGVLGGE